MPAHFGTEDAAFLSTYRYLFHDRLEFISISQISV